LPLNRLKFKENRGLGHALKNGVEACSYGLIARMDADDISREDRFEKQLKILSLNPEISLVGSWVSEFEEKEEIIYATRKVPLLHTDILRMAKYRCPVNHVTVMYKKEAVLNSGNYNPYFRVAQDYVLWISMLSHGYKFANIPECLVNVKAGPDMIKRRSGLKYMKYEIALQKEFLEQRFINRSQFYFNVVMRSILRLIPGQWRGVVYQKFLRK
jgi:glycosyltransferase involved in cell wall biosynthesis